MARTAAAQVAVLHTSVDASVEAAAEALTRGDPLTALDLVALRRDAVCLALRGTAMAQLGDYASAKALLLQARDAGSGLLGARTDVALAEVEVALRELTTDIEPLVRAGAVLQAAGDVHNASLATLVLARRALLLGRVTDAAKSRNALDLRGLPPRLQVIAELVSVEIGMRCGSASSARAALLRASEALVEAPVPGLRAEIDDAHRRLEQPAASILRDQVESKADLAAVEALATEDILVVDACRRELRTRTAAVSLSTRLVPFDLARELAATWPEPADRDALIRTVFGARRIRDSDRVKLRVEVGRLRPLIAAVAAVEPVGPGYVLRPLAADVAVLSPPFEGEGAMIRALLADGAAWSAAAVAAALGVSVRTAQRLLKQAAEAGDVVLSGSGRTTRWVLMQSHALRTPLLLPRHDV